MNRGIMEVCRQSEGRDDSMVRGEQNKDDDARAINEEGRMHEG